MFVEVRNSHPRAQEFIKLIQEFYEGAEVHAYEFATYVTVEQQQIINFFSSVSHDAVLKLKIDGELLSFPIDMFGTIYEM